MTTAQAETKSTPELEMMLAKWRLTPKEQQIIRDELQSRYAQCSTAANAHGTCSLFGSRKEKGDGA